MDSDPNELFNLAGKQDHMGALSDFRNQASTHWDSDEVRKRVIADQERRRAVHAALRIGRYQGWDFQPVRDAREEFTRSHLDLTRFDISSRFPRPPEFDPKWR